jgi:selenocysteine lyase/cysteine desulfurase
MNRRDFLVRGTAVVGAAALGTAVSSPGCGRVPRATDGAPDWAWVRAQFELDPNLMHFAGFFMTSHPTPVREAVKRYRAELDRDPFNTIGGNTEHLHEMQDEVRRVAGEYLDVDGEHDIALTDSTTMGLGLVYNGFKLKPGDEVLTTTHDHPATRRSLRFAAARSGCKLHEVTLYDDGTDADAQHIADTIVAGVTDATRLVAITWVHSSSGVKLPVRAIADGLAASNQRRAPGNEVVLAVDGVHGLGVEDCTMADLGCDMFIAGTHKWMFSPRGTGIVWAKPEAWEKVQPIIPPSGRYDRPALQFTPGGFHSFEHRWAAVEGFRLHMSLGKSHVQQRIHALNRRLREELHAMQHVHLHTPLSDELAAGIVCFDVEGLAPRHVIARLARKRIVASESPYEPACARLAASVFNTEEEVEAALHAVRKLG